MSPKDYPDVTDPNYIQSYTEEQYRAERRRRERVMNNQTEDHHRKRWWNLLYGIAATGFTVEVGYIGNGVVDLGKQFAMLNERVVIMQATLRDNHTDYVHDRDEIERRLQALEHR